jgi:hypothetical protein
MKQRKPAPAQYAPKVEPKEPTLSLEPCINCHCAITDGYWARYGNGGVCSKTCSRLFEASRPSLIDYIIPKGELSCGESA